MKPKTLRTVPTWRATTLVERLRMCAAMLAVHGVLTRNERIKVETRIYRLQSRES